MSQPRQAVILAAGMGERLSNLLPGQPKGFLEIAGLPIIKRSIHQLKTAGIHDIVIVTGYASAYYENLARRHPEIRLVKNERYAVSGSLFSLYCAREYVQDAFLLLESDLVYETRALTELVSSPKPNAILMSGFTRSEDEVFIGTNGERVVRLSKDRTELDHVTGELVGISKVSPDMFDAMIRYAESRFPQTLALHYEDGINGVTRRVPVFCHKIEDLVWAEIDTPAHLRRVEQTVLPRLLGEWTIDAIPD